MTAKLTIDTVAVQRAFKLAPKRLNDEVIIAMRGIGADWERYMKTSVKSGARGTRGGKNLIGRSGNLQRSIKFRLNKGRKELLMLVGGKTAPYAGIHETGGVIRPKRAKYLTIPLNNALTPSGVPSGSYKIRKVGKRYVTDKGPTFIYKSKRGNLLIAVNRNDRKKINLKRDTIYVLKRSVRIKPRLGAWTAARLDGPRGATIKRRVDVGITRALRSL